MSKKLAYIKVSQKSSHGRQRLPSQRYFTCVLTLCCFSCKLKKNPLMTANKMRHSPFSYQIFTMQARAAIQVCCVQIHRLSAKKEQKYVLQSTFFFVADSRGTNDILYHCQRIKQGFMVFSRAFMNT